MLPCWALCSWTLLFALPSTVLTQDSQPQPCLPLFFFYFSPLGNFFLHISPPKTAIPREMQTPDKGAVNARQVEA